MVFDNADRHSQNNGKNFYLLPIYETIRLEAPLKAGGVLIFQSSGLNMDSCRSRKGGVRVWINILDASNNYVHFSIRPNENSILFNHFSNNQWGREERMPMKGLFFKEPNPTIVIYDNGDRYQVMVDYVTVAYFEKRIKEAGVAVSYDMDIDQVSPFSNTLAMTAYTSFADVITRVTS
ncbi:galectin [Laccaria bicolor S238N-H82]|uniref:Galectin n=1 Tax=Laccaria bicolor (strain S238N-H82 / ATCC MYA-4686) TaxID=486041 RepID=B0DCU2_LACBS|nr:galectin [Laccaria bicolor S238N-H82]EDR07500.1 galectin [Laccaria bicolor S238N-H82]|eukprot:XP_001881892.1 galectin [Laccaria bicolor S238N-H82]